MSFKILQNKYTGEQLILDIDIVGEGLTILYEGSEQEFNSLGFNKDQINGFEHIQGSLIFNPLKFNNYRDSNKPTLSGLELSKKIRSLFKGKTLKQRVQILKPVLTELNILELDDEITLSEYQELKQELLLGVGNNLTTEEKSLIEQTLDDFITSFKL